LRKVSRMGLPNCYVMTNGAAEVVVATDIGPRVVGYNLTGGENVLGEHPGVSVTTEWGEFKPWGGHRLWTSPEAMPRSYAPDNDAVEFDSDGERSCRLVRELERNTYVRKELTVTLDEEGSGVTLTHRVTNRGAWRVELGAWGLTIMRGGGEAVIPQEPYGPHPQNLLPARPLVLWPYTDMSDARLRFGRRFVRLKSDPSNAEPEKIGLLNKRGWAAYVLGSTVFVKHFQYREGATYPDYGCNNEFFTAGSFIEVESLSPLKQLEPGDSIEHVERWQLFDGVNIGDDEDSLEEVARLAEKS
jgi:hypothetical protein